MHMTEEVCLAFKECAALFGTVTDCIIFNVNMYYSIKKRSLEWCIEKEIVLCDICKKCK